MLRLLRFLVGVLRLAWEVGHPRHHSTSRLSLWSERSFLSIASKGSMLSIGSVGSFLSIGSVGSAGSVLSIGSFASIGSALSSCSRWSLLSHRSVRGVMAAPPPRGDRLTPADDRAEPAGPAYARPHG